MHSWLVVGSYVIKRQVFIFVSFIIIWWSQVSFYCKNFKIVFKLRLRSFAYPKIYDIFETIVARPPSISRGAQYINSNVENRNSNFWKTRSFFRIPLLQVDLIYFIKGCNFMIWLFNNLKRSWLGYSALTWETRVQTPTAEYIFLF